MKITSRFLEVTDDAGADETEATQATTPSMSAHVTGSCECCSTV